MYEMLKKLLSPHGPSGWEMPVAEVIRSEIGEYVDDVRIDALGNVIATRAGSKAEPRRVMISAHMDHIGYVVVGYEKEGFLRVAPVGGISMNQSLTRHVSFGEVQGVLVRQPADGSPEMKHLFIDIGAENEEQARAAVQIGEVAVYAPDCFRLGEHRVASPAMDDRCACAMLVRLLQTMEETGDTIIAVFSVQEEVGCRGAQVASFAEEPDVAIALDVTAWGDTPGTERPSIRLGDGIAVKIMDRGSISNPALREALLDAGELAGVKTQREVLPFGGTDAGAMQRSRGGIPVCTLSVPCRYVHSACEVIDLRDLEGGLTLLKTYLENT